MSKKQFSLGIDLGTSNSVVALAAQEAREVRVLDITQAHGPNSVEGAASLPSALYLTAANEFEEDAFEMPVAGRKTKARKEQDNRLVVGRFAREHGAQRPDRLVISAKSWLCNPHIDHRQAVLPWGSTAIEPADKVSPVEASRLYLERMRESILLTAKEENWNIEDAAVVITVPASFDELARQLTIEAAEAAGFTEPTLMEEPQAAFYAWLERLGADWRKHVSPGDIVLICDVGGGTSDFSLIAVSDDGGDLALERISVGAHILLGGDNVDLALAYALRQQMEDEGRSIDDWQFLALIHASRHAKEQLYTDESLDEVPLAVPSRGSSLVAGSVSTRLPRSLLNQIVLDGFLALTSIDEMPQEQAQVGLREHGLAYAHDPVLSKHLAAFLTRSRENVVASESMAAKVPEKLLEGTHLRPTAVLFNGGFFKARPARERLLELLGSWCAEGVRELQGSDYDLAVARGACNYGLTKISGKGVRIRAGAARSYYIGLETTMLAIPGFKPAVKAICVVPQGMEEGSELVLEDKEFALVTGEVVSFRFFSSTSRAGDTVGTIVDKAENVLEETANLQSLMAPLEGDAPGEAVPVRLHSRVTELGSLELWMQHTASEHRWKLEFNVRTE